MCVPGGCPQADPYVREQLERCEQDLAALESRQRRHKGSESDYLSCRRSLQQALREIKTLIEDPLQPDST